MVVVVAVVVGDAVDDVVAWSQNVLRSGSLVELGVQVRVLEDRVYNDIFLKK